MTQTTRSYGDRTPPADDLSPAVAVHRERTADLLRAATILVLFLVAYAFLKGLRTSHPAVLLLTIGAWIAGGVALMALLRHRRYIAVGPGWLAVGGLLKRRWVRSDQLVSLRSVSTSLGWTASLRDQGGRRVHVDVRDLLTNVAVAQQLRRDLEPSLSRGLDADSRTLGLLLLNKR